MSDLLEDPQAALAQDELIAAMEFGTVFSARCTGDDRARLFVRLGPSVRLRDVSTDAFCNVTTLLAGSVTVLYVPTA